MTGGGRDLARYTHVNKWRHKRSEARMCITCVVIWSFDLIIWFKSHPHASFLPENVVNFDS